MYFLSYFMNSVFFTTLVFLILLGLIVLMAYLLFVPIENEEGCINYCKNEGYIGGFCREASIGKEIIEIEAHENANFTGGPCLWNPIALDMERTLRCFCRKIN